MNNSTEFDCSVGYIDEAGQAVNRHFFVIPTQPAEALGVCKNCGVTRLMGNVQTAATFNNEKRGK